MSVFKGIDVSKHNGSIDWGLVKKSGIDFALIRAGYGRLASQVDIKFEENYAECKKHNIACGAYWYSYAKSVAEARLEAEACMTVIKGKQFEYPIYFDMEEDAQKALGKNLCSEIAIAFCEIMEKNKYWTGLYSFDSWYLSNWNVDMQQKYTCWVARVENVTPIHCLEHDIWQYSWKGSINGISTPVDLNYSYKNFPTAMKKAGLNGFAVVIPTYSVTAVKKGLSQNGADILASTLTKLGMASTVSKEQTT